MSGAHETPPLAPPGQAFADGFRPGSAAVPSGDSPALTGAWARIVRAYVTARAVLGVALVLSQAAKGLAGVTVQPLTTLLSGLYAAQAVVLWLLPRFAVLGDASARAGRQRRTWAATIGVDLLAFSMLFALESGSSLNVAALLFLPVLMAGVLMPRLTALATTAAGSIVILVLAWRSANASGDNGMALVQAGLTGLGLFLITLLASELAGRLAREERAARGSLEVARQQAQLNRLVIEEMSEGVLVVDRELRVRAANPAARDLIAGEGPWPATPFELAGRPQWLPLAEAVRQAFDRGQWPENGADVRLPRSDGAPGTLRMRVRFTTRRAREGQPDAGQEEFGVLLLEDLRSVHARIRQDKLAAMGRMSAGIAHEIRNPLAAISQANALMLEDAQTEQEAQLARMVADNVRRLQAIVEDVLEAAPGAVDAEQIIDAAAVVRTILQDWARTAGLPDGGGRRLKTEVPASSLLVWFDADHLRRVLVNLLDNALEHGTGQPDSMWVRLQVLDDDRALLCVASDGPAIPAEVERHLFEPFFSTRSRGTGLGLYICRELCERHGAQLDFRAQPTPAKLPKEFVVAMRRAQRSAAVLAASPATP